MASSYPGGLDNFSTTHADNVDEIIHASTINDNADAINKIEAELGTDPKGSASDVKTRIANTETVANAAIPKSTVTSKGDLMVASGSAVVSRLGVGTDGQVLTLDSAQTLGVKWAAAPAPTRQIFTASGTYTLPAGCKAILVECVGGGGAGGGTPATAASGTGQCAAGGGGRGGSYAASLITSPSSSYTVTIGAGGTGSAGAGGGDGSDTSFGTAVVAGAGKGAPVAVKDVGSFPDTSGSVGGANNASTGAIIINGGVSIGGMMLTAGIPVSGAGGPAPKYSTTVLSGPVGLTSPGKVATAYGSTYGNGGSGATAIASAAAQAGGNGCSGICVVTEYY